ALGLGDTRLAVRNESGVRRSREGRADRKPNGLLQEADVGVVRADLVLVDRIEPCPDLRSQSRHRLSGHPIARQEPAHRLESKLGGVVAGVRQRVDVKAENAVRWARWRRVLIREET